MAASVYVLCTLTSLACVFPLFRGYCRTRARFLLWSSLCFVFLAANNALLLVEKLLFPEVKLSILRSTIAIIGLSLLLFGLVWDTQRSSGASA